MTDRIKGGVAWEQRSSSESALVRLAFAAMDCDLEDLDSGRLTLAGAYVSQLIEGMQLMALHPEWAQAALREAGAADLALARDHLANVPELFPIEAVS